MVNLPLPFRKEVQGLLKRGWLIWNFMVISFDSVTFSSSFKSLNPLSDKDRGTMAPGFKSCLAMISLRSVNFSALLFLASLPYILENCCLYYEIELQIFRSFLRYLHKVFLMFLKKLYFMCVSSCLILARPKQKWEFLWLPRSLKSTLQLLLYCSIFQHPNTTLNQKNRCRQKYSECWMKRLPSFNFLFKLSPWLLVFL